MWSKCISSVCFILNVTAIKQQLLHLLSCNCDICLWHAGSDGKQQNNSLPWSVTMEMCSTSFKRLSGRCEALLAITLSWFKHKYVLAPQMKTNKQKAYNSCLFYSHGWIKMVACMERQPPPPSCVPMWSYRDDTLYWNMRNPANCCHDNPARG